MKRTAAVMGSLGLVLSGWLTVGYADTALDAATVFSNPAKSIVVKQDMPQFTITLASNRTTGYSWQLLSYNDRLFTLSNHQYTAPTQAKPGASGQETWTFKVNSTGFIAPQVGKIDLLYAKPWDLKDESKQVEFKVVTQ